MTTMSDHIRQREPSRRSVPTSSPKSNIDANYNDVAFNMNNYIMEVTPTDNDLGEDIIKKDLDDNSPMQKAFNKTLMVRQNKPEVIEQPALGTNTNDLLDYYMQGKKE